jgi:RNA polymerase sigma-70 factor, ECF subfamily
MPAKLIGFEVSPLTLGQIPRLIPESRNASDSATATREPTVDRDSFDRLMLEHLPAAQRLAIRLVGNLDRAEELVQEAMLRASRRWQSFRGEAKFTTWLFQIVINVFRDQLRKRRVAESDEVPNELIDDAAVDPSDVLTGTELGELVARYVSNLPPRQREVLVLVAYEQMTPAQAADVLDISEQNARTSLYLARQALKKRLAIYLCEDGRCERRRRPT